MFITYRFRVILTRINNGIGMETKIASVLAIYVSFSLGDLACGSHRK